MYGLGKFLQAIGLVLPLFGLFQAIERGSERGILMQELALLAAGACLFFIGYKLCERAGGS